MLVALWSLLVYYTVVPWSLGIDVQMSESLDISIVTWILIGFSLVGSSMWFIVHSLYPLVRSRTIRQQTDAVNKKWYDNDNKPLVSIIIPARNEENVIRRTIEGCLRQTYGNIEVLVVCHNCTDGTYEQARKIPDSRVHSFDFKSEEAGKGIALNYATSHAKGDFLLVLDSDGIMSDTFIDMTLPLFGSGYAAVQGKIVGGNRNYSIVSRLLAIESDLYSVPFMAVRNFLDKRTPLGGTGLMIRKDLLQEVGGFRNALVDDFELSFRLFRRKHRIAFAPLSIVYDEKPPEVKQMIRQRSRWIKGHMDLLKERIPESSDIMGNIYWLQPIFMLGNLSLIGIISAGLLYYILLGSFPYTFSFVPILIWLGTVLTSYTLQMVALTQDYGAKGLRDAGIVALLIPFSHYWYATLVRAFFVKSWANTKTVHGFTVVEEKASMGAKAANA